MLDAAPQHRLGSAAGAAIFPLVAEGLVVETGGRRLVDGIDLRLDSAERVVILGPNGAGKSLLLKLLDGIVAPSAGRITWNGRPADAGVRSAIAMVFQRPVLLRRSVAANLEHALAARGIVGAERRQRVADALAMARLAPLAGQPARLLSGGEQQRLALARALALQPRLLFLDEPTASLDPASTLAVEGLIEAARHAGAATVLVTHDRGQARRHADRILFMQAGRIVEDSPADAFFAGPRSAAGRAYLEGRIFV
ncbi:energy-coupling factor ABC transporter ATP-binding protein [Prosthecodimorpha staleyi]|uniref:ATP-binding cassette domain-containing protein n=1 Tax=Prosthecodimorpha staleyi TaxID=2840188 RepID=A0A947D6J6_9HYPH|nr:ATP-binding cassette domain-containing protein [Prosthecodimorpha staleyi]MBT9289042.1 ATP-binding cassette domain-containing protein [Prosthecodimorpha staleyi]